MNYKTLEVKLKARVVQWLECFLAKEKVAGSNPVSRSEKKRTHISSFDLAIKHASTSLRACYTDQGIVAGPHHFTDCWARDSFFASLGALELGDQEVVAKMVQLFFTYQRDDGMLPYRIMRGPVTLGKYLGKPKFYKQPKATFRLRDLGQEILDGTTLALLFAAKIQQKNLLPQIKKALNYLSKKEKHGLLWDGPMAEWNDAVWKFGNLLYSNVIYWKMYQELSVFVAEIDLPWSKQLSEKARAIAQAMRQRLWNGQYFADWHDWKRRDHFYPFGNCLAVIWGLTNKDETDSILTACAKIYSGPFLPTNLPRYPWYRIDFLQRLAGMADYQNNGIVWWQPITAYIKALRLTGQVQRAEQLFIPLAKKITDDEVIHECYESTLEPVRRKLYTAEHPFAWASGMIIWAIS